MSDEVHRAGFRGRAALREEATKLKSASQTPVAAAPARPSHRRRQSPAKGRRRVTFPCFLAVSKASLTHDTRTHSAASSASHCSCACFFRDSPRMHRRIQVRSAVRSVNAIQRHPSRERGTGEARQNQRSSCQRKDKQGASRHSKNAHLRGTKIDTHQQNPVWHKRCLTTRKK